MISSTGSSRRHVATAWEYEISLRGELATGHGAGAAVYAFIQNDQPSERVCRQGARDRPATPSMARRRTVGPIYRPDRDGYAVYGFDGGSNANRGYAGYFYSTNGIGVYGYSGANRTHPNIFAPGVYGQSNQGVGVYGRGDTSNSYSFLQRGRLSSKAARVSMPGAPTPRASRATVRGSSAVNIAACTCKAPATGSMPTSAAMPGSVPTASSIDRRTACRSPSIWESDAIEPGDLVAMVGVAPSPENGQPMLAVAKVDASNRQAVIGVAKQAFSVEFRSEPDGKRVHRLRSDRGRTRRSPRRLPDDRDPGTGARCQPDGFAQVSGWRIGDRIALGSLACMEPIRRCCRRGDHWQDWRSQPTQTGTIAIVVDID